MTAVRLANAEILLHSPCRPSPGLVEEIGRIGQVTQVVAPNWFHDLYLAEYRALYPTSTFWAPRFLQRHQKSIVDDVLDGANRPPWFSELPYISVPGLLTFDECVFFQNRTRTLIVADLLMNASVSPDAPRVTRLGYRLLGLEGRLKVFLVLRWFRIANQGSLRRAKRQIFEWNPERLIVGHGTAIEERVGEQLRDSFEWV
ncbi:MAG: DUF4336 domain-containing protein [Candidatus Cybelea sp.]